MSHPTPYSFPASLPFLPAFVRFRRLAVPVAIMVLHMLPTVEAGGQTVDPPTTEPRAAQSQQTEDGSGSWNSARVLSLVERGRVKRQADEDTTALLDYQASAEGHVYFLMDRTDTGDRSLVKADQLALEVSWRAPGLVRQEIVGRRDEKRLPTNIQYHLDHLTVITDNFDDRITLGHGDEVSAVVHPLAPQSGTLYDFELADSLTLGFPGRQEAIRVYQVRVRPRDPAEPGVVGSIYLDRSSAAVVRMTLTFTPSSYVDPFLDQIRISLDNGLWEGEFWLPYRQEIEIRREVPFLGLPAGSVIRALFRVGDYRFNTGLPRSHFAGPRVVSRPPSELRTYPFQDDLFSQAEEEGLVPTPSLEEIRGEAFQLVAQRQLSGLRSLRPAIPDASSVFRYNRAEGIYLGMGASYRLSPVSSLGLRVGHAFGRGRPGLALDFTRAPSGARTRIGGHWNRLNDIGPIPGASGLVNSMAGALIDNDYLDPYFSTGVEVTHRIDRADSRAIELSLLVEDHTGASYVLDGAPAPDAELSSELARPVRPVDEGLLQALSAEFVRDPGSGTSGRAGITLGRLDESEFLELTAGLGWSRDWIGADSDLDVSLQGGLLAGDPPAQSLYLLGGRETLPGHAFRAFTGNWFWLGRITGSWGLAGPWFRPRAFASAGQTGFSHDGLPSGWAGRTTGSPSFSAGVGAGLFWNVVHVDVGHGLNGGGWEWMFSVRRSFRPFL